MNHNSFDLPKARAICLLAASLIISVGCASQPCLRSTSSVPLVTLSYRTTDAVGLIQELHLLEDGWLRLNAANQKRYCSHVPPSTRAELMDLLKRDELISQLGHFGESPRYPGCFVAEELTITLGGRSKTARIDALEGELLFFIQELESVAQEEFGREYMISLIERATQPPC